MGRLRFRSAADAFAEAERMEELRDDEVRSLRDEGREAAADRASDKWATQIEEVRAEGRRLETAEARKTRQPKDTPAATKTAAGTRSVARSSSGGTRPSATRRASTGGQKRSPLERATRAGYRRSGAQATVTGWGTLAWQIVGMTIGIAILTIFISSRKGTGAFAALTSGLAGGLELLVGPIDPLAQGAVATTVENTTPPAAGATSTSPGLAQVPKRGGRVLTGKA